MKKIRTLAIVFAVLMLMCIFAACKKEPPPPTTYTVTFDANGGSILSGESIQTVEQGKSAVPPTPERKGYEFDGWEGNYQSVTADCSIRAKWIPVYAVRFDADGGTVNDEKLLSQIVRQGESATIPEITRDGYEFDGWDTDTSVVNSDMVAKAKWTRLYTVNYILAGANTNSAEDEKLIKQTIRADEEPTAPKVSRKNYIFKEWSKSVNEAEGKITYTAVWERQTYTPTQIHEMISEATVEVATFRRNDLPLAIGSGFFIAENGTLITNYHVVESAYKITVTLKNGTVYTVNHLLGYDEDKDVAYLSVNTEGKAVPYIEFSDTLPAVGEAVYAIGSSLGLTGTFSSGIVSYVNREVDGVKFIQTTAPISSGNSGGPLVNQYGQAVGMNTATYTEGQNLNLSVTTAEIKSVSSASKISVEDFCQKTSILEYYPGEMVVEIAETASNVATTMAQNGYTYESNFNSTNDLDTYLSQVDSPDKVLLMIITVDSYDDLYFRASLACSLFPNANQSSITQIDSSNAAQVVVQNEDGTYSIIVAMAIPEDKYKMGYKYYGIIMGQPDQKMEYSYFSYVLSKEQSEKFAESYQ